jgi:hypothetical protein
MDPASTDPNANPDDIALHNYQDDLDTDGNIRDPIMDEEPDDPTEELGVDKQEFKDELDKTDFDFTDNGDDDMREEIEGQ